MYLKRILMGASIVGAATLPLAWLGTGVAAADPPADGPSGCSDAAQADPGGAGPQQCDPPPASSASGSAGGSGFELPPGLSEQLNQAAGSLPSPVQVNVPVGISLPGVGLPGLGISVPLTLGGLGQLPPPPQLPEIGPPQLPALPQLPF